MTNEVKKWVASISTDYEAIMSQEGDYEGSQEIEYKDGWIKDPVTNSYVVEYGDCGSHEAQWRDEKTFKMVLATPVMLEALKNIRTIDTYQLTNYLENHEFAINLIKTVINIADKAIKEAEGK